MRLMFEAAAIALLLSIAGCASADKFLGRTIATYEAGKFSYDSNKNQEGFKAKIGLDETGKLKELDIQSTATTPEAAMVAAAQANREIASVLRELVPLLKAAVSGAALGAGVPVPVK